MCALNFLRGVCLGKARSIPHPALTHIDRRLSCMDVPVYWTRQGVFRALIYFKINIPVCIVIIFYHALIILWKKINKGFWILVSVCTESASDNIFFFCSFLYSAFYLKTTLDPKNTTAPWDSCKRFIIKHTWQGRWKPHLVFFLLGLSLHKIKVSHLIC